MAESKPYIGGQAVLEGVMMRAPSCMTVAVRRPDGTIAVKEEAFNKTKAKSSPWKLPFLRGMAMLVESMRLGFRALQFSAEQQLTEEQAKDEKGMSSNAAIAISVVFALALFIALPQGIAWGGLKVLGLDWAANDWRYQALIGVAKLGVIGAYMIFVSRLPEMRRVFQYHGAEHKTIYAYEAGLPLTLDNVRAQSTLHPRCGTTFLIVVVFVSVFLFVAVAPFITFMQGGYAQLQVLVIRLLLLPFIAAAAYELQRLTARYCTTGPLRALLWPGFLFQKITTREPDDAQLEIAIVAMKAAEWLDHATAPASPAETPGLFTSFSAFEDALRARPAPLAAE
ncbi:MAG: DUF1385 domain-containing protein [Polyangiales bacterium]